MSGNLHPGGDTLINSSGVRTVSRIPLLIGFLGGPILWSLYHLLSQIIISAACSNGIHGFNDFSVGGVAGWEIVLLVLTAVLVVLGFATDLIAFSAWRKTHVGVAVTGAAGGALGRSGWLALAGVLLSTFFLIGIVAAGVSIFWLSGCA
jgi:hypothetical protein